MAALNDTHLKMMEESAMALKGIADRYTNSIKERPTEDEVYAAVAGHNAVISGFEKISKLSLLAEKNQIDKDGIAENRAFLLELHNEDSARYEEAQANGVQKPEFVKDENIVITEGEKIVGQDNEGPKQFKARMGLD